MCKWFDFESVNVNYEQRNSVASRIWINIRIEDKNKTYYISGQRNDIVKRRLIDWLRSYIESQEKCLLMDKISTI